jgi:hypothetical protein
MSKNAEREELKRLQGARFAINVLVFEVVQQMEVQEPSVKELAVQDLVVEDVLKELNDAPAEESAVEELAVQGSRVEEIVEGDVPQFQELAVQDLVVEDVLEELNDARAEESAVKEVAVQGSRVEEIGEGDVPRFRSYSKLGLSRKCRGCSKFIKKTESAVVWEGEKEKDLYCHQTQQCIRNLLGECNDRVLKGFLTSKFYDEDITQLQGTVRRISNYKVTK